MIDPATVAATVLSERGAGLIRNRPVPGYVDEHSLHLDDLWDADTNPDGYVPLCIAENKLVWDLLEPRLTGPRRVTSQAVEYDDMVGSEAFRTELAGYLGTEVLDTPIDPAQIAVQAGSGTVLEALFTVIADPGDGVLIPTPSYAGFWPDIETRPKLTVVPVHTPSDTEFALTADLLDAALAGSGRPVSALLFTSPSNPLGRVYSPGQLDEILDWADHHGLHLVLDELFALSVFGNDEFVSGASRRPLDEKTHVVWAFSKDFAASGLRCGVLVSGSTEVVHAVDGLAYWGAVSGDTQELLRQMIADREWAAGFVAENSRRLGAAYEAVTAALTAAGIPFLPGSAGLFFIIDMRPFMEEVTWEAEAKLWRWLVDTVNVNLTPGAECRIGEPGFMRLVFAAFPTAGVLAGIERMGAALGERRVAS